MASQADPSWRSLSDDARDVFGWAAACEKGSPDVGTRALLIGILRSGHGKSPADDLLRHFDVVRDDLFEALQGGKFRLDPYVVDPAFLSELPPLTSNAAACLERAEQLRSETARDSIDVSCLFGAILESNGTARSGLARILGDALVDQLAKHYLTWLHGSSLSYGQALAKAFPAQLRDSSESSAAETASSSSAAEAASSSLAAEAGPASSAAPYPDGRPWRFLVTVGLASLQAGPDRLQALGFVAASDTVVTSVPDAVIGHVEVVASGASHRAQVVAAAAGLARAILDPPLPPMLTPPIADTPAGSDCWLSSVDQSGAMARLSGQLDVDSWVPGQPFVVHLANRLQSGELATGSPVLDAAGAIVGIVVDTDEQSHGTRLRALGSTAIMAVLSSEPAASATAPATISIGNSSGAGNDVVAGSDQLGFDVYVSAFADLITSPHTKPPLTIGIFGSWGMGKSFLLEHIRRTIQRRQDGGICPGPLIHPVTFNAWEYSATDAIWPALVRKIVKELDQLSTWPRHKRVWTRLQWNLRREWRSLRIKLATSAMAVTAALALAVGNAGVRTAVVATLSALGIGGLIKAANDPVAKWVTALFADSDYGGQIRLMEDVKHDLDVLERRLYQTGTAGQETVIGRILVVIDDLDRCEPAKAVEVLQAVNLLLNFDSFIVCLGIDARIITAAVEKHYEGLLGTAGASGYEYLDKIVQIPFRIPEPHPDEIGKLIRSQLEVDALSGHPSPAGPVGPPRISSPAPARNQAAVDAGAGTGESGAAAGAESAAGAEPAQTGRRQARGRRGAPPPHERPALAGGTTAEVPFTLDEQAAFELFLDYLRPNPRHVKRLINVYRLVRSLGSADGERLVLDRPSAVLRWLIMWGQWPYTSFLMLRRLDQLGAGDVRSDIDPMLELLDQAEPSIDERIRSAHDDDPAKLRGLLSIEGCQLSVAEIRRLRRYTVNFNPAVEEYRQAAAAAR